VKSGANVFKHAGLPGVDVRGLGGYVIGCPSIHESGLRYEWDWAHGGFTGNLAKWPDIYTKIRDWRPKQPERQAPKRTGSSLTYAQVALNNELAEVEMAHEGERNDTLNRAAFSLARLDDLDENTVRAELTSAALRAGLNEDEIRKTLDSAYRGRRAAR